MKTKILPLLLLCMLFVSVNKGQAGEDEVFPISDAIWSIYVFSFSPTQHYFYGLTGDTLINEMKYSKLYLLNDSTLNIDEKDIYVAGIRQENKVVYILPAIYIGEWDEPLDEPIEESVLYDFSKTTGDGVTFSKLPFNPEWKPFFDKWNYLFSDESQIIEDRETRFGRMLSLAYLEERWIENVGSVFGLFFPPIRIATNYIGTRSGGMLGCMKHKGEIKYINEEYCNECFGETIYNNPLSVKTESTDKITVKYDNSLKQIILEANHSSIELNIYTSDGQCLINTQITGTMPVDISSFMPGIYIYQLTGNGITQNGKILVN